MNPFESMTLREIIRSRPLGIGILEESTGGTFWGRLDTAVSDFSRESGLDLKELQHRFGSLPVNQDRLDWRELPLYFLVDHLTANHRVFRTRDLPEIHRLLENLRVEIPAGERELSALCAEFKDFRRDFSWHMEEEEEFIFPKILRTEASLRHPELYPEVFKGSIRMFSPIQSHDPEETFHELVAGLYARLRGLVPEVDRLPVIKQASAAMQAFEAGLRAHTYFETEILFRRALQMEDSLLRRVA